MLSIRDSAIAGVFGFLAGTAVGVLVIDVALAMSVSVVALAFVVWILHLRVDELSRGIEILQKQQAERKVVQP